MIRLPGAGGARSDNDSTDAGQLRVRGVDGAGQERVNIAVAHGQAPRQALRSQGFRASALTGAQWEGEVLVITYQVHPASWRGHLPSTDTHRIPRAMRDRVVRHQRLAAYAVVTSSRGVLLTSLSASTGREGLWILPGGGIDPGENPVDAVHREVWEETGQRVESVELFDVASGRRRGPRSNGDYEDFHAVRLLYRATCAEPTQPTVHDVGGSTEQARWFPLSSLPSSERGSVWSTERARGRPVGAATGSGAGDRSDAAASADEVRSSEGPGEVSPWALAALEREGLVR